MNTSRGKRVLVTGASRGIGRAIALRLASAGADVVIAARSRDELQEVAEEIVSMGRRCLAVPTDLRDPASIAALVREAHDHFEGI